MVAVLMVWIVLLVLVMLDMKETLVEWVSGSPRIDLALNFSNKYRNLPAVYVFL